MWRFKGSPSYLTAQGDRLGLSRVLTDRARLNPEIHRVSILLGQLCERFHRAPKDDAGNAAVFQVELAQVKGTLSECELEAAKLHALAAAAAAMLDEAHAAFGLEAPARHFRVLCDFDAGSPSPDVVPISLSEERATAPAPKARAVK